jgi:hypothetical protein
MKLSKLTRKQVIIIGIVLLVVIAAAGAFALIKPANERLQQAIKDRDDAKHWAGMLADKRTENDKAVADHKLAEARLNSIYRTKMPYISLKDPVQALGALWIEYGNSGMGPRLTSWVHSAGVFGGGVKLPDVRNDPPPQDTKEVAVTIDSFEVLAGSYSGLISFLNATTNMPRLGSITKLTVTATTNEIPSPPLKAAVPMTVYLWTRDYTGAVAGATGAPETTPGGAPGAPPSPGSASSASSGPGPGTEVAATSSR